MTSLADMAAGWRRFWFTAAAPERLALVRIAFFGTMLALVANEPFALKLSTHPASFWRPMGLIALLVDGPPRYSVLHMLEAVWVIALAASMVGLVTRLATVTAAATTLFFVGLQNSFGAVSHGRAPLVLAAMVLAMSACGDSVSMDAWRRARADRSAESPRYNWPLQLLRTIWCLVFFAAGVSKLVASGPKWVFSENMATLLLVAPQRYPEAAANGPVPWLGTWIAHHPTLCMLLALGSLALELAAPLALLGGRWTAAVVALLSVVQVGICLTMFENFVWFLPLYSVWAAGAVSLRSLWRLGNSTSRFGMGGAESPR